MSRLLRATLTAGCLALLAQAQEFPQVVIEMIGKGYTFTEGPAWSKDNFLVFSDTAGDRLWKWMPGSLATVFREKANGPSGNAFDSQGRLYTCETHARRITRTTLKDGRIEVLAGDWEGKKLNAPCDLAVSKSDHVYFTDPAFGNQQDHRDLDFYGVYHIPPKGPIKLVAKPAGRPNGIAISPSGRLLYVTNSDEKNIRAYDLDRNGEPSNERVVVAKVDGVPAGLRVNESGQLYVATAKGIEIFSAEGRLIHTILHDGVSNCAFDADGKTLYCTARDSLYRIRPDVKPAEKQ